MRRKTFLKQSSIVLAGGMMSPYLSCTPKKNNETPTEVRSNWAGNYTYKAKHLHRPSTVDDVVKLVKTLDEQKALGSRHCFNNIADSPQHQISLKDLNKLIEIDETNNTVTIEGGVRYGDFCEFLHGEGYALHNLASLPHITVVGACATATHGSGVNNGNLATAVRSVELVTPAGEVVSIDKNHPDFYAVVVGLGAFGIITKITLEIQDTYDVEQYVFRDLPLGQISTSFREIMSSGYSVSLFTDWMDEKISEVWVKRRVDATLEAPGNEFYGARAADKNLHPIEALSAESCTDQLGVPGPWYNRIPHFKMGFTPSAGAELQSEYFIPFENAVEAILEVEKMKEQIFPHLMITEIRSIASDDFWMSPCYQQDSVAIHFTWKQEPKEVMALLPKIEETLAPYGVKPHWGKLFTVSKEVLGSRYSRIADFRELVQKYDPEKKFINNYLSSHVI